MLGIVVCPGAFPTIFALLWDRQTKPAALIAPVVGMACGFAVWFGTAYHYSGEITITSTGKSLPCMFGCITSMFVPVPVSLAISFIWPARFDWEIFRRIERVGNEHDQSQKFDSEAYFTPERIQYMKRMSFWAVVWSLVAFFGQIILWPLPMYGAKMIFTKKVGTELLCENVQQLICSRSSSHGWSSHLSGCSSPLELPTSTLSSTVESPKYGLCLRIRKLEAKKHFMVAHHLLRTAVSNTTKALLR